MEIKFRYYSYLSCEGQQGEYKGQRKDRTRVEIGELSVRRLEETDLPLILLWRNKSHVLKEMTVRESISESRHREWFQSITDRREEHFIYSHRGEDVGSLNLRFDKDNVSFEAGILCGEERYFGHGINIIAAVWLYDYGFNFKQSTTSFARVLKTNTKARRLNTFLGYTEEGEIAPGVLSLRLEKNDFLKNREKIVRASPL